MNQEMDFMQQKFLINKNEKLFIYVGEINKGRGITNLLEIFKDLKNTYNFNYPFRLYIN